MRVDRPQLKTIVVKVASQTFGANVFHRRSLMEAVETEVKSLGFWEASDNDLSGSVGIKSKGMANIDWAITQLSDEGGLRHVGRDQWQVANV